VIYVGLKWSENEFLAGLIRSRRNDLISVSRRRRVNRRRKKNGQKEEDRRKSEKSKIKGRKNITRKI
jgi:hypothetical protein